MENPTTSQTTEAPPTKATEVADSGKEQPKVQNRCWIITKG